MKSNLMYCILASLVLGAVADAATTRYVNLDNPSPASPYDSWATAATNIQAAVDAAADGDSVVVTNGYYLLSSEILVTKSITIQSVNGPNATIVDGGGTTRCFNLTDSDCFVSGFTITNGHSADYGGGIDCRDSSPAIVENCIITGNSAAYYGGGMSDGTANNCIITENFSGRNGGGMSGGVASNCTISGNAALGFGGGLDDVVANNCIISGNSAESGGGTGGGVANNCVISGNSATKSGGGMNYGTANNCTMVENQADYGCGAYMGTLNNCIVWHNSTGRGYDDDIRSSFVTFTCSPEVEHGVDGNITNAPQLVSVSHVAPESPCRGAGSSSYSNGVDIDGEVWLDPPSMGCDEYHGVGSVTGTVKVAIDGPSRVAKNYSTVFSARIEGPLTMHVWDFGDGMQTTNNLSPSHAWSAAESHAVVLTAFSDSYPSGISATQVVEVVSLAESAIHVSARTGSDANNGLEWATAKATIQAGVDAQEVLGGVVLVTNGTYAIESEIIVDKDISIQSINGPEETIVDGGGSNRCFRLEGTSCGIDGLTVTNGFLDWGEYNSSLGGGIYCSSKFPIIENCIVSGNTAMLRGGGIYYGTASHCTITSNSASYGGGVCYGTLDSCTLDGNRADNYGGGMYNTVANHCTIRGNHGMYGGGASGGTANDCLIIGNSAASGGGMRYGTANNCTVVGNVAISGDGGGMQLATINNCIVWYNTAEYAGDNLSSATVGHSCSPDAVPGVDGNITNAPLFMDFAGGDYRLQSNSPCINWGSNAAVPDTVDMDGNPRIVESCVDMGAYEYQGILGLADSDGDGLLDDWERQWFGGNVLPEANPDGDGSPNGDEFVAGTDPTNGTSFFATANSLAEVDGTNCFVVEWISIPDRLYSVQWSTNLVEGFQTLEAGIEFPQDRYTDTTHNAESGGFYRVDVRLK